MSLTQIGKIFLIVTLLYLCGFGSAFAEEKFFVYNLTTNKIFTGVYLAPAGSSEWSANQALNDKDKSLDPSERLLIKGFAHGKFDLKLVDKKNVTCIRRDIDLSKEATFDIRDTDLTNCT